MPWLSGRSSVPEEWRLIERGINLGGGSVSRRGVSVYRCLLGNQVGKDRCWGEWSRGRGVNYLGMQ